MMSREGLEHALNRAASRDPVAAAAAADLAAFHQAVCSQRSIECTQLQAVSAEGFSLIMSADDLENALNRASSRDHVLLLMAGATWCSDSRAIVQHVKVG